jgi:2'-5' RNA ligase
MRLFVAIDLEDSVVNKAVEVQNSLKQAGIDAKWVDKNNLHLTLKFIGEFDWSKKTELETVIRQCTRKTRKFDMSVNNVGVFPGFNRPKIVLLGVKDGAQQVIQLAHELNVGLEQLHVAKDANQFFPHLTVARLRPGNNKEKLREIISGPGNDCFGFVSVREITLFESKLTPSGPIYNKQMTFELMDI